MYYHPDPVVVVVGRLQDERFVDRVAFDLLLIFRG
jgi:hypothetical protein